MEHESENPTGWLPAIVPFPLDLGLQVPLRAPLLLSQGERLPGMQGQPAGSAGGVQ